MQDDLAVVRIVVEVEPDRVPICGRLMSGGSTREFTGWLELTRVLERAITERANTGGSVDGPG